LTISHLLVGIGLSLIRLPLPAKLAVWIVLSLSLSRLLLRQRRLPAAIKLRAEGRMQLIDAEGGECECRILPDSTVMPWLVVLRYRMEGTTGSLVMPVDSLGREAHRQLRTWLRWRASVDQA
jgi:toxin CptA